MTRYNLDLSVNADLTDWLSIKGGMKFFQKHDDRDRGEPSLANFSIVPSTFVAKQTNGDWGTVNGGSLAENNFINYNPLRALSKGDWQKKKTEKTMYNLGFDLKPIKGLTISGQGSYTGHEYKDKMYTALQDNAINYFSGEKISGTGNAIKQNENGLAQCQQYALYWNRSLRLEQKYS
ncbi:Putative TonB-dependent outer membrane receptor protein [Bacteroides heparinolyticus]|uniref:TonB-dependent outer membrane receptor protein n=2 Tax=Prevotella heparinolytica TaxID=28113 RepID=A0A449I5K7_9BACE|nr:Putative TonB-dependent outer membrane receptor protein [Bacteroides heparinolyticus]